MSRQPRLFRRGAVYYFRAAIPRDLQAVYGKREIIYSLKTRDRREAERLVRQASASLDNEFDEKRARPSLVEPLRLSLADDAAISHICDLWRHQCLDGDAFNRSGLLTDEELDEMEASRIETEKALRKAVARGRIDAIQPALQQHLAINGIAITGDAEAQRKLGWAFLQTVAETHRDTMSRDQDEVVKTPPAPDSSGAMAGRSTRAPIPSPVKSERQSRKTLAHCFDLWQQQITDRPAKTVADFSRTLEDFAQLIGRKAAAEIDDADVQNYIQQLLNEKGLAPTTVEKKLTFLGAIYAAARKPFGLPDNPFSGVRVPKPRVAKITRQPFSGQDLQRIFGAAIYRQKQRPKGGGGEAAAWLPLLALYTGARLEELAQLRTEDVREDNGIHYLDINDLDDGERTESKDAGEHQRRLKTESSRRRLPLHRAVIEAGFLHYVARIRRRHEAWLFPELNADCHGKRSGNWSKWWGRYRKRIGVDSKLTPFHSFRHSFRDACREADLDEEIVDNLMGHSSNKTGRGYGRGHSLKALDSALQRIAYPGLEIPQIEPEGALDPMHSEAENSTLGSQRVSQAEPAEQNEDSPPTPTGSIKKQPSRAAPRQRKTPATTHKTPDVSGWYARRKAAQRSQ